jgi:hypothetical protein
MNHRKKKMAPEESELEQSSERYQRLKRELVSLATRMGFLLTGSLQSRFFECTRDNGCRCHDDPAHRHGPYHYWTRAEKGKHMSVGVPKEQLALFEAWRENTRAFERIVSNMRRESLRAIALATESGPRKTTARRRA